MSGKTVSSLSFFFFHFRCYCDQKPVSAINISTIATTPVVTDIYGYFTYFGVSHHLYHIAFNRNRNPNQVGRLYFIIVSEFSVKFV